MTVGTGIERFSERNAAPLRSTISAFSLSTSTTARRAGTTHKGSKLALSKSARATAITSGWTKVYRRRRSVLSSSAPVVVAAPAEVTDDLLLNRPPGRSVGSVDAIFQVRGIRQGEVRRAAPPGARHGPDQLPSGSRPELGVPQHRGDERDDESREPNRPLVRRLAEVKSARIVSVRRGAILGHLFA